MRWDRFLGRPRAELGVDAPARNFTNGFDTYEREVLEFAADGWDVHIWLHDDVVAHVYAMRTLRDLDEGLMLLAERGTPDLLRLYETSFHFMWDETRSLTLTPDGDAWKVRVDAKHQLNYLAPSIPHAEARAIATRVRALLAEVPAADGARGAAVATWRERFAQRLATLEAFLDVAERAAPATPIAKLSIDDLDQHADWLAHHDRVFDRADDHGDAIVLADVDARGLGWIVDHARERDRLCLVRGPFAAGVARTRGQEVLPLPAELPDAEVTDISPPQPPYEKMIPKQVRATVGDVTVELSGGDLESIARVARALAALRFTSRRGP